MLPLGAGRRGWASGENSSQCTAVSAAYEVHAAPSHHRLGKRS